MKSAKSRMTNYVKLDNLSNTSVPFKPPIELYKAAAIASLLTASALEGAGLALQQAIKDRSLTKKEARDVVKNLAQKGGSNPNNSNSNSKVNLTTSVPELNLRPGVKDTTNLILDIAGKTKNAVLDGIDIASKKSFEVGSKLLSDAMETILPTDLLNKPYAEINPKFSTQISQLGRNFEAMAQDPQAKQAIANLAKAVSDVGIDAINAAKPQIDKLVARIWEVANNVGDKSVRSAMNVGLAMLITALSEVPVVGGVVVGGLEAGSIFNNVVETGSKAVQGFTQIANDGMAAVSSVAKTVGQSENKIKQPLQQVKGLYDNFSKPTNTIQKLQNVSQQTQNKMQSLASRLQTPKQIGGMRKKTRRIENRLHKTIKKFISS